MESCNKAWLPFFFFGCLIAKKITLDLARLGRAPALIEVGTTQMGR